MEQLQNFREKNLGAKWIVKPEALIMEKMAHKLFTVINIFVGLCLGIVGISMISTKLFIDVPYMQKKYEFYRDVGMKSKTMRQELRKETLMIIWVTAFFAILMAGGYEAELLSRFLWIKGSNSTLAMKEAILEVCQLAGSWLGIAGVFVLINFVYGECILGALRRRVLPNKKGQ